MNDYVESCCMQNGGARLRRNCGTSVRKQTVALAVCSLLASPIMAGQSFSDSVSPTGFLSFDSQTQGSNGSQGGLWYQFDANDSRDWLTRFTEPGNTVARSTLSLDQQFTNHTLHYGLADADDQTFNQFGVTLGRTTVLGFSGSGDTTSSIVNNFNHVDPFHFHGGLRQDYQYEGAYFGWKVSKNNQLGFTRAVIQSDGLFDREVSGFDWQGKKASLSLMQVAVGDEDAGIATGGAMQFGRFNFNADYLRAENEATFTSFGLQTVLRSGKRFGMQLEHRRNPLFEDANENRLTFNLAFKINSVPRFNAEETQSTETVEGEEAPSNNTRTGLLIGAAAVGGAVALSSGGGSDSDSRPRFNSQEESAFNVLNGINPESVRLNREHGGYIYRNADGSFSSLEPILGELASISLPAPQSVAPSGSIATATYHTHGGPDPRFDNENFSPQDLISDIILGLDGYLGTPAGQFMFHNVRAGTIQTLGGPGSLNTTSP